MIRSIGPVWDGNEVWLLAGGGTLYFAFPALYSASFSGFYLALMMVLWLLILRGVSVEIRGHVDSSLWRSFWDIVFGASSALLCLLFGVALGNVIRGVPLDSSGYFFIPLWTNFQPGDFAGIIDWYTLLIGIASFGALALHGCLWIALKTSGGLRERCQRAARGLWWLVVLMTIVITALSFRLQPHLAQQFSDYPFGFVFPAIAIAGLAGTFWFSRSGRDRNAFLSSCAYLLGMLTSVVFGVYPYVLPANTGTEYSLNIWNAAAPHYGLVVGLWWWIPGMILAGVWNWFAYRRFSGRASTD